MFLLQMMDTGYEFFEHTADVGLRATGRTLEELFVQVARGLTHLLVEDGEIRPQETREVTLRADSAQHLLWAWLKAVLDWFNTDRFLVADCRLDVGSTELRGRVLGERFDPNRHAAGTEVKGVTHHQFTVEQTPRGWQARIIFDV